MTSDNIAKVQIDAGGRLCVWPAAADFTHIYRAAMEVNWNESGRFLYSPAPRAWSYAQWFTQIIAAAKDEYGCVLKLTERTVWENIDSDLRESIIASAASTRA